MTAPPDPRLRLRLVFGPGEMIGPGKAELLTHIDETGSIAAAGRRMGMSYKRAWVLVETMNAMFSDAVVTRTRGGPKGGGATLTDTGRAVLAAYKALAEAAEEAGQPHVATLTGLLQKR